MTDPYRKENPDPDSTECSTRAQRMWAKLGMHPWVLGAAVLASILVYPMYLDPMWIIATSSIGELAMIVAFFISADRGEEFDLLKKPTAVAKGLVTMLLLGGLFTFGLYRLMDTLP